MLESKLLQECRTALAFATSVIKCGEDWSPTCDEIIIGTIDKINKRIGEEKRLH